MKSKIRQYKLELETGNVYLRIRYGVIGAWVSATPEYKTPLTRHNIYEVHWLENIANIGEAI
jgi:hypothetical protein